MARCIARNIIPGIGKTILIQDTPSRLGRVAITQAGRELRANLVRSLIAVSQKSCAVVDRQWLTRLQGSHTVQCPATDNGIQHTVHAASDPAVSPERKVHNDGCSQPMRGVVRADPMLGSEIVEHLWVI